MCVFGLTVAGAAEAWGTGGNTGGLPLSRFTRIRGSDADTLNDSALSLTANFRTAKPNCNLLLISLGIANASPQHAL
jgi:hypothetical protein